MKETRKYNEPSVEHQSHSTKLFRVLFLNSLREIYFAENAISHSYGKMKDRIVSVELQEAFNNHYLIHRKHLHRVERIFQLIGEKIEGKKCGAVISILEEAKIHVHALGQEKLNLEVALLLTSQKLAHYKIAVYGGLAHLAIHLKYFEAATFLAISVQEEEHFADYRLRELIEEFLSEH